MDEKMKDYLETIKNKKAVKDHIAALLNQDYIQDTDKERADELLINELVSELDFLGTYTAMAEEALDNWLEAEGLDAEDYEPNYDHHERRLKNEVRFEVIYTVRAALEAEGYTYDEDRQLYISEEAKAEEFLQFKLDFYEVAGITYEDYLLAHNKLGL